MSDDMSDDNIRGTIERYIKARRELLEQGEQYPQRIGGNDNIIGRIGEFIALRFLERLGQQPVKMLQKNNRGFDLKEGSIRTQVKVITAENQRGGTVPLRGDWEQFLLIELDEDYRPVRVGLLTSDQHEQAKREDARRSATPTVARRMLNDNGLIGHYGQVWARQALRDLV